MSIKEAVGQVGLGMLLFGFRLYYSPVYKPYISIKNCHEWRTSVGSMRGEQSFFLHVCQHVEDTQ